MMMASQDIIRFCHAHMHILRTLQVEPGSGLYGCRLWDHKLAQVRSVVVRVCSEHIICKYTPDKSQYVGAWEHHRNWNQGMSDGQPNPWW